jgi:hypothetical protein
VSSICPGDQDDRVRRRSRGRRPDGTSDRLRELDNLNLINWGPSRRQLTGPPTGAALTLCSSLPAVSIREPLVRNGPLPYWLPGCRINRPHQRRGRSLVGCVARFRGEIRDDIGCQMAGHCCSGGADQTRYLIEAELPRSHSHRNSEAPIGAENQTTRAICPRFATLPRLLILVNVGSSQPFYWRRGML